MNLASRLDSLTRALDRAGSALARYAPLLVRVVLGHGFFLTGLGKLRHFDATTDFFASLGIPAPAANAALVGVLEAVGGLALVAGLRVRAFAALLGGTLVVALLTHDGKELLSGGAPLTVAACVFLLLTALVFAYGAGPWSADAALAKRARPAGG